MIIADEMIAGRCKDPECSCVHLFLMVDGKRVASAALSLKTLPEFIKDMQDVAYEIVTLEPKSKP